MHVPRIGLGVGRGGKIDKIHGYIAVMVCFYIVKVGGVGGL